MLFWPVSWSTQTWAKAADNEDNLSPVQVMVTWHSVIKWIMRLPPDPQRLCKHTHTFSLHPKWPSIIVCGTIMTGKPRQCNVDLRVHRNPETFPTAPFVKWTERKTDMMAERQETGKIKKKQEEQDSQSRLTRAELLIYRNRNDVSSYHSSWQAAHFLRASKPLALPFPPVCLPLSLGRSISFIQSLFYISLMLPCFDFSLLLCTV